MPVSEVESKHRRPAPVDPFPAPRFPSGIAVGPRVLVAVLVAGALALIATGSAVGPGVVLLVVAVAVHLTLRATVVAPIRRLRDETRDARPLSPSPIAEIDRIVAARRGGRGGGRRIPMGVAVVVVAGMIVGWTGTAAIAVVGMVASAPAAEEQSRAALAATSERLRDELGDGLTSVETAAAPRTGAVVMDPAATAAGLLGGPFRSVSVLDTAARPVAPAGPPIPVDGEVPGPGVEQVNTEGAAPVVVASAPLWDGAHTLVAEFDPRVLNDVVGTPGVHTRVVDDGLRTVLDTSGYVAFSPLRDPAVTPAAQASLTGAPKVTAAGTERSVAAGRLAEPGSPVDPGWVVVQDQDVDAAAFAGDLGRRTATVIIALTAGLAALALAWTAVTVLGPLRALARHVEQRTGETIAPQRLDEIGAVASVFNRGPR